MKHYLTEKERKEAEITGLLEKLKAGGEMFRPGEIVPITDEQQALKRRIAKEKTEARKRALPQPRRANDSWFSLVSSIKSAQSVMKKVRHLHPGCSVTNAPKILHEKASASVGDFVGAMTSEDSLRFFNDAATALIERDSTFFKRVAEVFDKDADKGLSNRWMKYLDDAYHELLGSTPEVLPRKKAVRDLAVLKHATDDLWNRSDQKEYKDKTEFAQIKANEIELATKKLDGNDPKKNKEWTERFKKAGLNSLLGEREAGHQNAKG